MDRFAARPFAAQGADGKELDNPYFLGACNFNLRVFVEPEIRKREVYALGIYKLSI